MILSEVLGKTKAHFSKLGFESAKIDSEYLIAEALKFSRLDLYLKQEYPLTEKELSDCRELVKRRSRGEPVAYILGKKSFYNIELKVDPRVLIPRPETEHIVDEALIYLKEENISDPFILDLGAGSGCIGLAILKEIPCARLVCIEKSKEALELLLVNAKQNQLDDRCLAFCSSVEAISDIIEMRDLSFDLLVSNPPYIEKGDPDLDKMVLSFEPELALFAEDNGLAFYKTWPNLVKKWMKPGSLCLFEIGHKQKKQVEEIFEQTQILTNISSIKDYSGKDRVVKAQFSN